MAIISSIPNYRKGLNPSLYNLRFSLFRDRVNAYTISKIKKLKKSRNYKRLCRYLNYKLDDIKDVFMLNNVLGIPRTARMGLWENVMENKLKDIIEENSDNKCRRIYPYFQRIQRRRRKALENFCEDKEKKQEELKNVKFDMKKCLEFNEWVKESENKIFKLFKNNITERDKRKKAYIISDKCKLGNLNTLFGQMDCSDKIDRHFPYIFLEGNPVYPSEKDDDKNIKDPEEGKDEEEEEEDGEVTNNIRSNGEKGFPFVNNTPVLEGIEGSGFDLDFGNYDPPPPSLNSSEIAKLFEFNSESHVEHMNIVSSRSPNIVNIEFSDVPLTAAHMTSSITAKNISSYLYVPLGVLFIIISFIWFFLNRTKHLNMLIKEKEKVKTENIVPSEAYVKLDDLEVMKWYKDLKKEWIKEEDKYIDVMDLMKKDEIYEDDLLNKSIVELEKSVSLKHWKDMYIKWIDEDNERDWLRIAIDKKNIKTDEINEDINRMIELNKLDDYSNDLYDKKRIKWKTIIEIHMEVLNDCKNDEWEMNKGDFLEICLEEFGTMENKEYSHIINNMLMVGELEYKHLNMDVIERQNDLWNKWIEGHRYMLEKWKKEKWFIVLKENWKNEEHKYMRKAYLELLMSLREDVKNPLLQRQKIIWRKWIAKNLYHIESNVIKKWFDTLLEEIERKGVIELDGCINLIEMEENEEYLEYLKEYRKKKLICIIWIKIYMMIIEEHKKEEYLECKEIFLDTCVDELREQEILEGNELYMDDMKTSILLNDQKEEIEKLKMKKWYKDLKKEWIIEENRYFRSIINEEDDEEYKNMISKPLRDVEKKISKKHWEDIQLKWIDEDNERDWLKIARNENEEIKYLYINENVSKKKKKVPFYIDDYRKKGRSNKNKIYRRKREKCNVKLNENNTMNKEMENWENRMEFLKICVDLLKKRTFYYINIWEKNKAFYDETNEIMKQLEEKIFERQKILWYNKEDMNKMSSKKWGNEEWFIILKNDWNEEKTCYLNGIQYEYNINNLIEEEKKYLYLKKEKIIWKEWLLKNFKNIEECDNEDWFNNLMETYKIDEICTINMNGEIHSLGLENTLKRNFLKNIIWIDIFMGVLNACEEEEELEEHKHKNMLESKVEDNDKLFYEKNEDYINKNEMENYINDIQENEGNQMDIPDWFDAYQSDEMSGKQKSIQKDEQWFIKELEEGGIKSDVLQENYTIYNNKLIEQKMNILRESYIRNQNHA
ncbi:hypothetical protein PFMALIP_02266 [Plasmodium falciparum MaliPS096_E11]|uniref:Schizont-infected cell agglutination C-terminal domain-containing protein n=1 Tax=Plasmodium falciparum MaliPS096_E11 TaxID=1036727 RepID=A0A024WRB8_PLAFA|nr:hypothetical protein PFMALIP_02266 [Plasmodium falciparum MaliPS096_E11]